MWETLRNAWKIQDLRKKILYTVGMLLVYRLLCYVPTPGVDLQAVSTAMSNYSLLGFIDSITGSNLANYTIMAMVEEGLGVSMLYRCTVEGMRADIRVRPIVHAPSRDVVAAWRSWDTMPIATRRFIDYMSSHIVN